MAVISRYYGVPMLSVRDAFWDAVYWQGSSFRLAIKDLLVDQVRVVVGTTKHDIQPNKGWAAASRLCLLLLPGPARPLGSSASVGYCWLP